MSKPPLKGTATASSQTRVTTNKVYQTRSATTVIADTPRKTTADPDKLSTRHASTDSPLSETIGMLTQFVSIYKLDSAAKLRMEEIIRFAKEAAVNENKEVHTKAMQSNVSDIRNAILADLHKMYNALNKDINGVQETANATLSGVDKVLKETEESKSTAKDLAANLGKVTEATNKLTTVNSPYRNTLLATPSHKANTDPKILGDMDQRAKQILVDIFDEEGVNTLDKSLTELLTKANEVLDKMSDADKPEKVKVETVLKLRKNAVLLTLNSKEAVNWIKDPGNEMTFADAFSKGAHIREREYNLVAPRVPLTFEPENSKHLREIEEANSLPANVIRRARWIKPVVRRRAGQTHAYAILSITAVDTANKLIKDGIGICSSLIRPQKLKQEPTQCMKCRRWGHFAEKCLESEDTCGTCGGKHRTSTCTSKDKRHCVSCGNSSHASWDRNCPEFIRRCALLDERNPDNNMLFFPAEQDWTYTTRPSRIPLSDRFPAAYAVNSLPMAVTRNTQRRKGPSQTGKHQQGNPNLIPVPASNRFGTKEPGELANDEEGIPEWMREPIVPITEPVNSNGDVTQQPKGWN